MLVDIKVPDDTKRAKATIRARGRARRPGSGELALVTIDL
jgi:hypothetical protein